MLNMRKRFISKQNIKMSRLDLNARWINISWNMALNDYSICNNQYGVNCR